MDVNELLLVDVHYRARVHDVGIRMMANDLF